MSRTFTLPCRTSLLLAVVLLGLIAPTAQAQQIDLKEAMNKVQYYVAPLTTADPGGSNCDGGEHYDDGTIENGYSGNPSLVNDVDVVMLFTPASYPLVYNEVCFILVSLSGPTLTFDVVIYDDDGAGGVPGTLLYSETFSLTDVPGGINTQIYTFELTSPPTITSGSVYIGASWDPMSFPSRFVGSDESAATSLRSSYVRFQPNDPNWQATHTVFPAYKALAVRAASTVSIEIDLSLEQEGTLLGDHAAAWSLSVHNAGSSDATGVQVTDYVPGYASITDWETSHGTFNPSSGLWTVGDLLIDETATLEILTTLDAAGLYENCAEVTAANESDADSTPGDGEGDDYACTSAFLPGTRPGPNFERGVGEVLVRGGRRFTSDLDVTLSASDDSPAAGDEITLTVEAINVGPQVNGGVKVELALDECLSPVASSASRGSYANGTWSIGTLPVGTATLELTLTVGDGCNGETEITAAISGNLPNPNDNPLNPFEENTDDEDEATLTLTVAAAAGRITQFEAAYPNPFNPQTVVPFELKKAAEVQVAVFDVLGRRVAVLVEGTLSAGRHEAVFAASHLPTGTYLVRLEAAGEVQTQRIVLMK